MPHITLYNQVSGVSVFHFLPLLVGLFVTHVGRQRGAAELQAVLTELDSRGIGSMTSLMPGQMALIRPHGAHGVWVPSASLNPSMLAFEVSVIRAAELYVTEVGFDCSRRLENESLKLSNASLEARFGHVRVHRPEAVIKQF